MRRPSLVPLSLLAVLALGSACPAPTPAPVAPDQVAIDIPAPTPTIAPDPAAILEHVAYLADDAREGRAPGTEADLAVQAYIVAQMEQAGLEPGADGGFLQTFEVGDGVRLREGQTSALAEIPHALLPFGHDTGDAGIEARLVFVGDGLALDDLELDGKIAVALPGSADPHAAPATTRPQAKLIAARDRGAVGFVLWDPNSDQPWPNHGRFSELDIPAVYVGKSGSEALGEALRVRGEGEPKLGASSRKKLALATPIEPVILETANVIGRLPGTAAPGQRRQIVIGAHMDHLGYGTTSSLAPGERAIHNGADDNASGVAVVLELAHALAAIPPEQRVHDLVFVTFGAEEMGLLGSKHMVAALSPEQRGEILAMLNFDMVGRLGERLAVNGQGTAEEWAELVAAANDADAEGALELNGTPDGWGPSDHASFYGEGVPVLHFFTGSHGDYHKPSDDIDAVDEVGAARVGALAGRIALALVERPEPLSFVKVERPTRSRGGFRVSLGTMPDYAADVDGLALAGVSEGGPAATAGLQKGDVIKRIGAREVHNIDDYMTCFGELEPGEAVEIEWRRDGQRLTGELVPAAPRSH